MRKFQQTQILEIIKTLREAQRAELYADCQDGALGIGEYIEQIKGEGTQTVSLLEEYCEVVYKASTGEAGQNALEKALLRVENSVKNELQPTKTEVVFLSYKASMSDSIESIYTAAKEDSACDAYWIPIPYYDRNPDGTFGMMHYEGAEFYKKSIECTDWQRYDMKARHPDVIFTFAPYDALGHMTTVHPDYYCERLRELTDLLVYVPYFVAMGAVKEPYTKCPAVVYAHKIMVQSESVRQDYIRDYLEVEKLGYKRELYGAPEDKFIAIGSPKIDAVINAKPTDFTLPEAWHRLIYKTDGAKKKVVLYNTSITAALNNTEQYLKKLENVLKVFCKRTDIVLWWRPHPLLQTAFSSMYPELTKEYERIVAEYKAEGCGIYDDTPEFHRAIAAADAYFGDGGSVASMFRTAGKPILYQNISIDSLLYSAKPPLPPDNAEAVFDSAKPLMYEKNVGLSIFLDKIAAESEISFDAKCEIAVNLDGTCGSKIYEYVKKHISMRRHIEYE